MDSPFVCLVICLSVCDEKAVEWTWNELTLAGIFILKIAVLYYQVLHCHDLVFFFLYSDTYSLWAAKVIAKSSEYSNTE